VPIGCDKNEVHRLNDEICENDFETLGSIRGRGPGRTELWGRFAPTVEEMVLLTGCPTSRKWEQATGWRAWAGALVMHFGLHNRRTSYWLSERLWSSQWECSEPARHCSRLSTVRLAPLGADSFRELTARWQEAGLLIYTVHSKQSVCVLHLVLDRKTKQRPSASLC
jgi:hypothetical protein